MYDKAYIAHHGIKGQKWGVQNGPPYPIGSDGASKGTHRHIVKSKLSDEQKKKLGKLGKAALIGAGVTTAATAAAAGAGLGIYMMAKNPQAVAGALAKIGGKTLGAVSKLTMKTGIGAVKQLNKQMPDLVAKLKSEGKTITPKLAKKLLMYKNGNLSDKSKVVMELGTKDEQINFIINNIEAFRNDRKALGIVAPMVDAALNAVRKNNDQWQGPSNLGSIITEADNIAKAKKAGKAASGGILGAASSVALTLNALTNTANDIGRTYNLKNQAIVKDGKRLVSHLLASKNHYDDIDLERKKK